MKTVQQLIVRCLRPMVFKGKTRLMNALKIGLNNVDIVPPEVTELECIKGIRISTPNPRDIMFRELYLNDHYQDDVLVALDNLLKPGCTFWDVGANYGFMSVYAEKVVGGDITILAFEPNPQVAEVLRRNLELNQARNVEVLEVCVAEKPGTLTFYLSDTNSWNATIIPTFAERCNESIKLEMTAQTLDELVRIHPPPDVLKVDVEGAEHLVLEGGEQFLSEHHPPIVIEFNRESIRDSGKTPANYLQLFRDFGYDIYRLHRPWIGFHRWEGKQKIEDEKELPALCNIVLLKKG